MLQPTSGLDSTTSFQLCSLLNTIAKDKSLVVAAIIHSPSQQCFNLFEDLLLLGTGGQVVYHGPRKFALQYFLNLGFEKIHNQADPDFFMDVVSGKQSLLWNSNFRTHDLFDYWTAFCSGSPINPKSALEISTVARRKDRKSITNRLFDNFADLWMDSKDYLMDVLDEVLDTLCRIGTDDPVRCTPSSLSILWFCMKRAMLQVWRSWGSFMYCSVSLLYMRFLLPNFKHESN
jgi:ABC-type multidrug transport system ATPase subunit